MNAKSKTKKPKYEPMRPSRKVAYLIKLVTERDALLRQLRCVDTEIEHACTSPVPQRRRGAPHKYDQATAQRIELARNRNPNWNPAQLGGAHHQATRRKELNMTWRDLLQREGGETTVLPWLGGRTLRSASRTFALLGPLPREHGWYEFRLEGRRARWVAESIDIASQPEVLRHILNGYLVGDRFATDYLIDDPRVVAPNEAGRRLPKVHLISEDVDRFARVSVGMVHSNGPLVFRQMEMPLGPEADVFAAYCDQAASVDHIKAVTPALDAAFRMESWQRAEAERRRIELERLRAEEEAKRAAEERRQALIEKLGDGAGRREMAKVDFGEAARAALAVGGAELLDCKISRRAQEWTVRYRLDGRRFECVCDANLHIVDAGICLQDHRTGIKGDTLFTLESLPAVVREADRQGVLVIFRNV
jgi:hypothetical protein